MAGRAHSSEFGSRWRVSLRLAVAACITGVAVQPEAVAQEGAEVLAEIIVTAQKRSENVRDVPISINVLTSEEISRSRLSSVKEVAPQLANVYVADIASRGSFTSLAIRGLGSNFATTTLRAAILVDDVPYTGVQSLNSPLFEIEQMELLRGPQSTLFGLTAEAGVLNIKSVAPRSDRWGGKVSLSGSAHEDYEASASVSGPLAGDRWTVGFSGYWQHDDGFLDNALGGERFDLGRSWAGRVRTVLRPTDALSFDLSYARNEISDDFGQSMAPVDRAAFEADFQGVGGFQGRLGRFEVAQDFRGFVDAQTDEISLRAAYHAPAFDLIAVSALRETEGTYWFDVNQAPGPWMPFPGFAILGGANVFDPREFTQELRLSSPAGGGDAGLSWVGGVFYYAYETTSLQLVDGGFPLTSRSADRHSRAVFADAKYRFDGGLGIATGARYERSRAEGAMDFSVLNPAVSGLAAETEDSALLPRLVVDYRVGEGRMVYGSVSRGWLPGGVSISAPAKRTFAPEKLLNYELGTKTAWMDGRVRFDAALFHSRIDDYQEQTRELVITPVISNAGEARIQGAEMELSARVTRALDLGASIGFNDAEYTNFRNAGEDNTGNDLPGVPRYNGSLSLTYTLPSGSYLRARWLVTGKYRVLEDRANRFPEMDGYDVLNLLAGVERDSWSAALFVNNVTDDRYFTSGYDQVNDGRLIGSLGRSREIGAQLSYRF
jgi:iron complex outermembrane receptor protein